MMFGQFLKYLGLAGYPQSYASPTVLAQSAVPSSVTGTTTETTLATIAIPAAAMGTTGALRIHMQWTFSNNADTKTFYVRLGGTFLWLSTETTEATAVNSVLIRNRGSLSSQLGGWNISRNSGIGDSTASFVTSTINMGNAQNLTITGQLGTSTDTITLEGYTVELINP